jgi:lipoprotein-anchoring transpeptidase ErfK/SrfK
MTILKKHLILGIFALFAFASPAIAAVKVTIYLSTQSMTVEEGSFFGSYRWKVSTARPGYVTPKGMYKPYLLKKMHYSTRYDNSPMPYSIFFNGNFAIHGTNYIKSLGRPASHGCVRLDTKNAKRLFEMVKEVGMENTQILIIP